MVWGKTTHLWGVSREAAPRAWPLVQELVKSACDLNELHSPDGIQADVFDGRAQLWVAWEGESRNPTIRACLVTKLEKTDRATWCRGLLLAGSRPDDWFDHLETIEAWAVGQGAQQMNFIGRCGLEKWLKPKGYRRTHFLMEKRL